MNPTSPDRRRFSAAEGTNSVRRIVLTGIFWRILWIEAILLVWSVGHRAITDSTVSGVDLFWYAIRIILLIAIIIAFVVITLNRFLKRKIIVPLEAISRANRGLDTAAPAANPVELPENPPDEIQEIVDTRQQMVEAILSESRQRLRLVDFIRDTFGRYLSKKVVDEILESPEGRQIGGRRETVTILMADLRGFTSLSDTQDPARTLDLLNRFFEAMSAVIYHYDGMIDEFLGDGMLVIFGVPERHADDPARAVASALAMQNRLAELNADFRKDGYPHLEMGIGINTGTVIVGNIGSEIRAKYGIVGSAVNIAGRIESITTGGQVLISEGTYRQLGSAVTVDAPQTAMLKGLAHPLVCYPVKAIAYPYSVQLTPPDRQRTAQAMALPIRCWVVEGKQVQDPALEGTTVRLAENEVFVALSRPLPVWSDVRLRLEFCTAIHCFGDIYAKVQSREDDGDTSVHQLRFTAMDPQDRELLGRWLADAR